VQLKLQNQEGRAFSGVPLLRKKPATFLPGNEASQSFFSDASEVAKG
jgi:hypothetical protein